MYLFSEPHYKKSHPGDNVLGWHNYGIKVQVEGKDYLLRLLVRETVNGRFYYDNDLTPIEEARVTGVEADRLTKSGAAPVSGRKNKLLQWLKDVKSGKFDQENRGAIQFPEPGQAIITLLENADLSTFLHESGHFFFETYLHFINQPDAPLAIKRDFQTLLDFVGVSDSGKKFKSDPEKPAQ